MLVETLFSLNSDEYSINVEGWSSVLGVDPIECCQLGKQLPNSRKANMSRKSYWTYGIRQMEDESINEQVSRVLDVLHPKRKAISNLIDQYELDSGLATFIWLNDEYDIDDLDLYLNHDNIKRLADLRGDFCIKIYD